jgi:hypothetical protein
MAFNAFAGSMIALLDNDLDLKALAGKIVGLMDVKEPFQTGNKNYLGAFLISQMRPTINNLPSMLLGNRITAAGNRLEASLQM